MRIVIAGGTGLIGRALSKQFADDGNEVIILSRNPSSAGDNNGFRFEKWDTSSIGTWAEFIDGAQIIVNFAGENLAGDRFLPIRWTESRNQLLRQSRIDAGTAIAEAISMATVKPEVLIQASAVGYYGPRRDEKVTESELPGDDYLANICIDWEGSTKTVEELGVRRVILRTGLVLSTKGGPLPRLLTQFKLFGGGSFGRGDQYWSWIHLDDVVQAVRFLAMKEGAVGPYNITSPTPVTNRRFSSELGRAMNRPSFWPIPSFAMKLLVGEVAVVVLKGQRAVPARLQEQGFQYEFEELIPALENILR